MDSSRLKRGGLRSSFTKTVNILKDEIGKEDLSEGVVKDKFAKLQKVNKEIEVLNEEILNGLISGGAKQEEITQEMESWDKYTDEFITVSRLVSEKLGTLVEANFETRSQTSGSGGSPHRGRSFRLPKIELYKFDGDLLNWLPFWSQFEKIHEDPDLHESDKFQYLVQSMKLGTRARDFIDSYPMTAKNYPKAIKALKERFGNSDLLIEVYVRELIKLIISNVRADNRDKLPLPQLFDKIEAQIRALESLDIKAESNTCWLYPMVESSLSEEVLRAWQRSSLFREIDEAKNISRLTNLMKFLKGEVEGEERLKLARGGFEDFRQRDKYWNKSKTEVKDKFKKQSMSVPTAAGFFTAKEQGCIFCDRGHDSKDCYEARSLSLDEKRNKIKLKRCCLKCLTPGHVAKNCQQFIRCYGCGRAHVISLCPQMQREETKGVPEVRHTTAVGQACSTEVALMTIKVQVMGKTTTREVRALLDCGSQRSYILESTAKELGLTPISKETVTHTLFGGTLTEPNVHNKYLIKLRSSDPYTRPRREFEFEFLDQATICGSIARIAKGPILKELKCKKVWLSDIGAGCPKIEILIGSDIYGRILTGKVKQLEGGLTAIDTRLGWAVCGQQGECLQQKDRDMPIVNVNLAVRNFNVSDLWSLETIGISDPTENSTKLSEEDVAREHFLETLCRNEEGRYCVGLPWLESNLDLPSNRYIAEKRLFSTTLKIKSLGMFEEYDKVFKEWLAEGVIEVVPMDDLKSRVHYLPHHPVIKPQSLTTKIRPVFDASCKAKRSPSLNDCLVKGPNLIEEIPALLLRFREKRIGVTADIRRAFLQIELKKEDRDFLRFLWWDKDDVVKVYRHTRVVFGVKSSPFLLGAVISYHLSRVSDERGPIVEKLGKSFYIDNCVTSLDTEKDLREFMSESTEILAEAKMDLRMWAFGPTKDYSEISPDVNSEYVSDDPISVLGLLWDREADSLSVNFRPAQNLENLSKREILSLTQGIFDPLGFLAPVMLPAKLLIQEAWATKTEWDTPLPEEIGQKFLKWYNGLQILTDCKLPRRVGFGKEHTWTLHIFCDSSQSAYATVIFLRCENEENTWVSFLAAKSRVAPLKKMTIPRLELLACVLGVRLAKYIVEALLLAQVPKYYWSDSTTALSWIKRNDQWGTFVGNRVREICALSNADQWLYVPSQSNPADLPSRGCTPRHFLKNAWWEGPKWLKDPMDRWPRLEVKPDELLISSELRRTVKLLNVSLSVDTPKWYTKFSGFSTIVKILAWVLRFISNSRGKSINKAKFLSFREIQASKHTLSLLVQQESFSQTGDEVNGLSVIRDESGLIRVKTRILEREDDFGFRYPVLLPSKHHIVESLILEYHKKYSHAGIQVLMSMIREEYWILSARRTIRSAIRKCTTCQRFTAKSISTVPIQLPLDRVRDALAFEVTGIDLCGPLTLKNTSKSWVVLFTCAVYRAVHLELVTSLSADCFTQALRRFIARRGRPAVVYSDNGTNFKGVSRALKKVEWPKIAAPEALAPIEWKFIPPTAAWWGGWWERLIRSVKGLLLRVLGKASLTYEELLTVLCDAEEVMNNRPLTYVSNDARDLRPLTPSNFLREIKDSGIADLDYLDRKKLMKRERYCQELRDQFRKRFRKEYLGQLVQKAGPPGKVLKVGEVVLVESEHQKRLDWPLAVIQELYTGRDGNVRVVKVKTQHGHLVRPVKKIYPLEVNDYGDPILSNLQVGVLSDPIDGTIAADIGRRERKPDW